MEIKYYGANCVKIFNKRISIVIDDNLNQLGLKSVASDQDVVAYTYVTDQTGVGRFRVNGPGEYEISEVSIKGVAAQAHIDKDGHNATMYSVKIDDFNVGIVGHIDAALSEEQLENIGVVDVLVIPVGNSGFTLDAEDAVGIIKKIEPKIVVPTHYSDEAIKYEVPQADLQLFLQAIGVAEPEFRDSLVLKDQELGDKTKVIVLNRQVPKG